MRRFLVPPFSEDTTSIQLDTANSHHLLHVLRVRRGATITVFTGENWEVDAVLTDVRGNLAVLNIVGQRRSLQSTRTVHLLLGIAKGPATDLAVRMATEAGVRQIHPMLCKRSVPKGDRLVRWRKIVKSASQQCGRTDLPEVHPARPFADVIRAHREFHNRLIALPTGEHLALHDGPVAVAVGPEGGFTEQEAQLALDLGFTSQRLGPYILRTDTAAAVATALALQAPIP